MSQKSVISALICVAVLLLGAIVIQANRKAKPNLQRSAISAPEYRPNVSPETIYRVLDQSPVSAARAKNTVAADTSKSSNKAEQSRPTKANR
jgi:hypothetical protein